jgi:hypothetical protein
MIQLLLTRHGVLNLGNGVKGEMKYEAVMDSRFRPSEMSATREATGPDGQKYRESSRYSLETDHIDVTTVKDGGSEEHKRPLPEGDFVFGTEWLVQLIKIGSIQSFAWREFAQDADVLTCQLQRIEAGNVQLRLATAVTGSAPESYYDLTEKGELIAIHSLKQRAVSKVVSPERFQELVVQFK